MAVQSSANIIRGTINNLTYYFRNNKAFVRRKSSLDKKSYYANKKNQGSKRNNAELGSASSTGKLFRSHIRQLLFKTTDSYSTQRFAGALMQVLKTDTISPWGSRKVQNGNLSFLKGFDFNKDAPIEQLFFARYNISIERKKGKAEFNLPPLQKQAMINIPATATHFKIITASLEVDFQNEINNTTIIESEYIPFNMETITLTHTHIITKDTILPLFLILAVRFYQNVNDELYVLKNLDYNPTTIVETNQV